MDRGTWTATSHLIVPHVVNVTSLTDVIVIRCICISLCKRCV